MARSATAGIMRARSAGTGREYARTRSIASDRTSPRCLCLPTPKAWCGSLSSSRTGVRCARRNPCRGEAAKLPRFRVKCRPLLYPVSDQAETVQTFLPTAEQSVRRPVPACRDQRQTRGRSRRLDKQRRQRYVHLIGTLRRTDHGRVRIGFSHVCDSYASKGFLGYASPMKILPTPRLRHADCTWRPVQLLREYVAPTVPGLPCRLVVRAVQYIWVKGGA